MNKLALFTLVSSVCLSFTQAQAAAHSKNHRAEPTVSFSVSDVLHEGNYERDRYGDYPATELSYSSEKCYGFSYAMALVDGSIYWSCAITKVSLEPVQEMDFFTGETTDVILYGEGVCECTPILAGF